MNRKVVSVLGLLVLSCGTIQAHEYREEPDPALGPGEVIVYKFETYWGLRDDPPKTYSLGPGGPFETRADADKKLDEQIARTKGSGYLTVTHGLVVRVPFTRSAAETSNPDRGTNPLNPQSKIVGSNLKMVDPGPSANSRHGASTTDANLLLGRKFKGLIGRVEVTFYFPSNEKVIIASLLPGRFLEAKWSFDEDGQLKIDANADFVASRKGDRFEGIRTTKDKSDKRPWSFDLKDVIDADASRGESYNDPRASVLQNELGGTAWARFEYEEGSYADTLRATLLVLYNDNTFAEYKYSNAGHGHFAGEERTLGHWVNAKELRMRIERSGSYSILDDGAICLKPEMLSKSNKEMISKDSFWNILLRTENFYRVHDSLQQSRDKKSSSDLKKEKFYASVFGATATKAPQAEYLEMP